MAPPWLQRRAFLSRLGSGMAGVTAGWALPARAHDFRLGDLRIDHPYALPTADGARTGAVYLRRLRNTGAQADRLIAASCPLARAVEIHRSELDAQQVMRMRSQDGLDLPPGADLELRHGGALHLMLLDLRQPLRAGDRFALTLRFQRAGEREVTVWVQAPRDGAGLQHAH